MGIRFQLSSMSIAVVALLLFLQFLRISASGFVLESKVCGEDRIGYSIYEGQELFSINGDLVDKSLFCHALQTYFLDRCSVEEIPGFSRCQLELHLLQVNLDPYRGRKLLQGENGIESSGKGNSEGEEGRTAHNPNFTIVKFGMVGPGIFALCCLSLCPCFFRKKRPTGHTVLSKDLYSSDSVSSFEANPSFERIPQSPFRAIASPRHVPPSPRFSMSPSPRLPRLGSINLNFDQVLQATQNFSSAMKIGKGAFGIVYKGQLANGQVIAIKRAKRDHFKDLKNEFSREVELLAKIDHQNLVRLLGFIDKGDERLIITEYVPNGTLRTHLDGKRGRILNFNQRLGIAIDVAHGLTYLHMYSEKQIIHRDVKSSNILLTDSMRAKVADFGFARLGAEDSDQSHVNTAVKGTVGYLDPEYMKTHQLTAKSDVYSLGILLLEILTGRRPVELKRPINERVTLLWVFRKFEEGNVVGLVDPRMEEAVDGEVLMRFFELAIQCAAPVRADRPDMKSVGEQLWVIRAEHHKRPKRRASQV